MYSPFKMKPKSPILKALVGKQNNLPAELKAKIEAAPESPAKMMKKSPAKRDITATKQLKKMNKEDKQMKKDMLNSSQLQANKDTVSQSNINYFKKTPFGPNGNVSKMVVAKTRSKQKNKNIDLSKNPDAGSRSSKRIQDDRIARRELKDKKEASKRIKKTTAKIKQRETLKKGLDKFRPPTPSSKSKGTLRKTPSKAEKIKEIISPTKMKKKSPTKKEESFDNAFSKARKAGKDTFMYKNKEYHTAKKGEGKIYKASYDKGGSYSVVDSSGKIARFGESNTSPTKMKKKSSMKMKKKSPSKMMKKK